MNKAELERAINFCIHQVDTGLKYFKECYPSGASVNDIYPPEANTNWTNGFWTGMLWLAYECCKISIDKISGYDIMGKHTETYKYCR